MTDREVMKMALEALFEAQDEIRGWGSHASDYFQKKHDLLGSIARLQPAINTLRQALAHGEQDTNEVCKKLCAQARRSERGACHQIIWDYGFSRIDNEEVQAACVHLAQAIRGRGKHE